MASARKAEWASWTLSALMSVINGRCEDDDSRSHEKDQPSVALVALTRVGVRGNALCGS